MEKSSDSSSEQPPLADLEFPEAPDFLSAPPRMTLEEYCRLNELWSQFCKPEPRVPEFREEFEL